MSTPVLKAMVGAARPRVHSNVMVAGVAARAVPWKAV
jgi:hypothetical protein